MKLVALLLAALFAAASLRAEKQAVKRERDKYQEVLPIEDDEAKKVIAAVQSYRKILESRDYKQFYADCAHSVLKSRVTEERFVGQIAQAADQLRAFFKDVSEAYEKKGNGDPDFQIGRQPHPIVAGTLVVQFSDRIDAKPGQKWPAGNPVRIQIALDGDALRFYDID